MEGSKEQDHVYSMALRHVKLDFKKKKEPRKTAAQYQAEYRARLKADPKRWKLYNEKQKLHTKRYLNFQNEEQQAASRARKAEWARKYRLARKEQSQMQKIVQSEPIQKKKTRKQISDQRAYWREKKRERRAAMTPEERAFANEKEKMRKRDKKRQVRLLTEWTHPLLSSTPVRSPHSEELPHSPPLCGLGQIQPGQSSEHSLVPDILITSPSPSRDSKYSHLKRVKRLLPQSNKVKRFILKRLVKLSSPSTTKNIFQMLRSKFGKNSSGKKKTRLSTDTDIKKKIISFFYDQAVDVPNVKFYSKRLKTQRKVLVRPISSLYRDFSKQFPDVKVSKRNFFRSRPKDILPMKSLKCIQCLCETCENVRLLNNCLKTVGSQYSSVNDALNATLCPYDGALPSFQCAQRECNRCGVKLIGDHLRAKCDLGASVTYDYWDHVTDSRCVNKKTQLVKKCSSVNNLIDTFCCSLQSFSLHKFIEKWQRQQFNNLKFNLPSSCALLVLDFSENYTCNFQNQAQAAYYSLNQVTIHPVVIYERCLTCDKTVTSYRVYISDDLKHDASFVNFILSDTLKHLNLSKYFVFSDNCCAQYKSRLPLYHLSQLSQNFEIERCFFGERHGKSECDSCGGVVKSYLKQSVACGRAVLTNAKDIVNFLEANFQLINENCSHSRRTFHYIDQKSVSRRLKTASIPPLKGIKKAHSFKMFDGCLALRQLSCFCPSCLSGNYAECESNAVPAFSKACWPKKEKNKLVHNVDRVSDDDVAVDGDCVGAVDDICDGIVAGEDNGVYDDDDDGRVMNVEGNGVVDHACDGIIDSEGDVMCGEGSGTVGVEGKAVVGGGGNGTVDAERNNGVVGDEGNGLVDGDGALDACGGVVFEENRYGDDACVMRMPVRRKLFDNISQGNSAFTLNHYDCYKKFYSQLENCNSFDDMVSICVKTNFEPLHIQPKLFKINPDLTALKLLPPNAPHGYLPNVVIGDGNCIPRSLSYLIFGDENHHLEIRCRMTKELVTNKALYLDSDFLALGSMLDSSTVLAKIVALSDSLGHFNIMEQNIAENVYKAEVFETRLLGTYLGPWHLHAAAQMLNCSIISLYPKLGPTQYSEILARAFVPSHFKYDDPLYVLWTSGRKDMKDQHWVANHVVPMVKMFK